MMALSLAQTSTRMSYVDPRMSIVRPPKLDVRETHDDRLEFDLDGGANGGAVFTLPRAPRKIEPF